MWSSSGHVGLGQPENVFEQIYTPEPHHFGTFPEHSGPDFAGYNLGPGSPELQLGVLGRCLTHIFLIQAADRRVPLDSLEVEVS